jgi:bacterioferritin-associated ferredoxin
MNNDSAKTIENEIMAEYHKEVNDIIKELGCSNGCADAVRYLRMRSRHTQKLEDQLVAIYKGGGYVNIMEWPPQVCDKCNGKGEISDPKLMSDFSGVVYVTYCSCNAATALQIRDKAVSDGLRRNEELVNQDV